MQMSDIDNKNFKTAYDNAVFLSGGRQTGGVQPHGRQTVCDNSSPDSDVAEELCALRETLPVGGIAFGDVAALIADFILNHFNVFGSDGSCEKPASGSDEKIADGSGEKNASSRGSNSGDLTSGDLTQVGSADSEAIVFTDDSGYFSVCKKIRGFVADGNFCEEEKRAFADRTVFFSVDDGADERVAERLLHSVKKPLCVVAAGGGELITRAADYCAENNVDLLAVPLDYSFGCVLKRNCEFVAEKGYFAFDDELFSSLQKNKVADVIRQILSKRILFIEMCVNQLIGLHFDDETPKKLLNESVYECLNYFKNYDHKNLVYAKFLSEKAAMLLPFESPAESMSKVLSCYDLDVSEGDREYFAYKMLVKIYGVMLTDCVNMVKVPSYGMCADQLKAIMPNAKINPKPSYYCNDENLSLLLKTLAEDDKLGGYIKELALNIPDGEHIVYLVYGGRKSTVELYPQNINAQSLRLAPLICKGDSLLKILWATGVFEWL